MSAVLATILADIKTAMKEKQAARLGTLRMLHSDIKNVGINEKIEVTDAVVFDVISKTLKQNADSLEQFRAGGRADLVAEVEEKVACLKGYLPEQLSEAEVEALVKEAIAETGATSRKEMGAVMKALGPKTKGRADNKLVSTLVQKLLG